MQLLTAWAPLRANPHSVPPTVMGLSGNWPLGAQPKHSLPSWTKSTAERLQQRAGSAKHFTELMCFLAAIPEQCILNTALLAALTWSYIFWSSFPFSNPLSFLVCPIPPQKDVLGTTHIKTECNCLSQNQVSSDLIINTFITSFLLDPPWRGVLFMTSVPTTHLTALSSACIWAARRASSQYWLSPHAYCLGNCLNCLPWPMCIWTDGKYLHSCQQEPRGATKVHLEWKKRKKKQLRIYSSLLQVKSVS